MAYQAIGLGVVADDGTGDSLRIGADKVNDNFVEVYTLLGNATALSSGISATATVITLTNPVITGPTISGVVGGTQTSAAITTLTSTTVNAGTLALAAGSVTDSSGAISFGNENLTTTGNIKVGDGSTVGSATTADAITIASTGIVTLVDDLILKDAATIGVTSSTSAISIASTGIVTLVDDLILKNAATIGVTGSTSAITIASTGIVTLVDDLILKDAATIGVTSSTSAISIASSGIVTLVDDLILKDAATIGVTSSTSAISIASSGIVTLVDDLLLKDACTIGTATTAGAISIAANGTVNLATTSATVNSAVIKTVGLDTIWVPATAMVPAATNPCASIVTIDSGSNSGPDLRVLDFDTSSDEHAQFSVCMPKSWDGGNITFKAYWIGIAATTGCSWALQVLAKNDNEDVNAAYGTAVVVDDASQGSATELLVSTESGNIACSGAADDLLFCQIFRDVSDSNDDMSGDARLVGIRIIFTTDKTNDD